MHTFACACSAPRKVGASSFSPTPPPPPNPLFNQTDGLPQDWLTPINSMDEVWVPAPFNAVTFAAAGVDPDKIIVVPESVDVVFFNPETTVPLSPQASYGVGACVFLTVQSVHWSCILPLYLLCCFLCVDLIP